MPNNYQPYTNTRLGNSPESINTQNIQINHPSAKTDPSRVLMLKGKDNDSNGRRGSNSPWDLLLLEDARQGGAFLAQEGLVDARSFQGRTASDVRSGGFFDPWQESFGSERQSRVTFPPIVVILVGILVSLSITLGILVGLAVGR